MSQASNLPAAAPRRDVRVVEDNSAAAYLFDTARFEHMQRIASAMASASLIPDHLKGKGSPQEAYAQTVGNCFLVVNQAVRWQMDPFAVAPETYSVGGKLAYQGKLVAAVVNARAGLIERLSYAFEGAGDGRKVTVLGTFQGEAEPRTVILTVKEGKTNNQMWVKDPDQKLIYSGVVKWARRHCPEVVLGVMTDDDMERMAADRATNVTPPRPTRSQFVETATIKEPDAPAEVSEAAAEATSVEIKPEAPKTEIVEEKNPETAKEVEKTDAEVEPEFTIVTSDGVVLPYDDYVDFHRELQTEMLHAAKGGLAMLTGWQESNQPMLAKVKPEHKAALGAAYKKEHDRLSGDIVEKKEEPRLV